MLCCLEEARRYKNADHMIVNHGIATVREFYVLYITPNKNGKVIFATH